jgi:hypothetical protein
VIVVANVTGVWRDVRLNQVVLEIWRMENNQCVEVWDHFSDQKAWDELWND